MLDQRSTTVVCRRSAATAVVRVTLTGTSSKWWQPTIGTGYTLTGAHLTRAFVSTTARAPVSLTNCTSGISNRGKPVLLGEAGSADSASTDGRRVGGLAVDLEPPPSHPGHGRSASR